MIMTKEIKNFIISGILTISAVMFMVVLFLLMIKYPIWGVYWSCITPLVFFFWSCYYSGVGMSSMGNEEDKPYSKQAIGFMLGLFTMTIEFSMLIIFHII